MSLYIARILVLVLLLGVIGVTMWSIDDTSYESKQVYSTVASR